MFDEKDVYDIDVKNGKYNKPVVIKIENSPVEAAKFLSDLEIEARKRIEDSFYLHDNTFSLKIYWEKEIDYSYKFRCIFKVNGEIYKFSFATDSNFMEDSSDLDALISQLYKGISNNITREILSRINMYNFKKFVEGSFESNE
jgi:hypothetical protein